MPRNDLMSPGTHRIAKPPIFCLLAGLLCMLAPVRAAENNWQTIKPGPEASNFSQEPTPNLVNADFNDGLKGWEILSVNGGRGQWRLEKVDGNNCFVIHKTNSRGSIILRTQAPIAFGEEAYRLHTFYQTSDAPQTAMFLTRVEKTPGNLNYDSSIEHGGGLYAQRTLINSPRGDWTPFLYDVRGTQSGKAFINLILDGNPCTVRIDRVKCEPRAKAREEWSKTHKYLPRPNPEMISQEQMLQKLKQLPALSAKLQKIDGITALLINGKEVPPVFYKENPGLPQYHLGGPFLKSGVKLQLVYTGITSSHSDLAIWKGPGEYNVQGGIHCIELALRGAPEAQLILDLSINAPQGWGRRHPNELWENAEGLKGVRLGGHLVGFAKTLEDSKIKSSRKQYYYSYFSPVWQKQVKAALRAYLTALRNTPYAKRVVGVMISGGHDGQFALQRVDHSPRAQAAFRQWLKETYQTPEGLSKAWHRPIRSFDDVFIPNLMEGKYFNQHEGDWIYDPQTERNYIDYRIFYQEYLAKLQDDFARVCKETMGKDIIAIRYFMSGFNNGFHSTFGVVRGILSSKYIDAVAPQSSYPLRKPGKAITMRQALESYLLHDKLVIQEFDHRTWLRSSGYGEMKGMTLSLSNTLADYTAVQRKLMGEMIARGQGFWFYDMVAGWYQDPGIQKVVKQSMQVYSLSRGKRDFHPDVAVIIDEDASYALTSIEGTGGNPALSRSQIEQLNLLSSAGVPYDVYYLKDLITHPELKHYKIFIFASTFVLTPKQRRFLDTLKGDNRILVWMYAPGYSDGEHLKLQNMIDVTGIRIQSAGRRAMEPVYVSNQAAPLARGLLTLQGGGYLGRINWKRDDKPTLSDLPQFYADDPAAVTLARFGGSGHAAIAVRKFDDWTSVYVAQAGGISPDFMHNLAEQAGAYVLTAPTILTEMNSRFISAHGLQSGRYIFHLPKKATVRDLNNGDIVAKDTQEFEQDVTAGKTYWFGMEQTP